MNLSLLIIIVAVIIIVLIVKNDNKNREMKLLQERIANPQMDVGQNVQVGLTIGALIAILVVGAITMFILDYISRKRMTLQSILKMSGLTPKRFD